jgi:hypothetical protein
VTPLLHPKALNYIEQDQSFTNIAGKLFIPSELDWAEKEFKVRQEMSVGCKVINQPIVREALLRQQFS